MSKRWLTAHWPHPVRDEYDIPWNVYLKEEHRDRAQGVSPGDKVLFFETGNVTGVLASVPRRLTVAKADGGEVVADDVMYGFGGRTRFVAEVSDGKPIPAPRDPEAKTLIYPNQTFNDAATWDLQIYCKDHRRLHVALPIIKSKLGVKQNPNLWRGLVEVEDVEAFDSLVEQHAKEFE